MLSVFERMAGIKASKAKMTAAALLINLALMFVTFVFGSIGILMQLANIGAFFIGVKVSNRDALLCVSELKALGFPF